LSGGKKMSKTLGNVISIEEMLEKFGVDGTRYLLLSAGTFGSDIDVTMERLVEKYNADLANGLGNLLSRVIKLSEGMVFKEINKGITTSEFYKTEMEDLELSLALKRVWEALIGESNKYIDENKPWDLAKNNKEKFEEVMKKLISNLYLISELLIPFMPETSEKIKKALETKKTEILFQRIK